jgi:hypothetical protein
MMSVRLPETCWGVNERQDNKLEKLLHLVGDLFELYDDDDARTYKLYIQNFPTFIWNVFLVNFFSYSFARHATASSVCVCVCIYVCVCLYIYIHIYICVCVYTQKEK